MKGLCTIFFCLLTWQLTMAQSAFLPKNLGATINSSYDDINPVVSPDGKTLYFVRVNHPENTYGSEDSEDIWYAKALNDSVWTTAQRIPGLNIARYNSVLSVFADGNSILLNGVFNKKGNFWKKRGLSVSTREGNGWSNPKALRIKKLSKENNGLKSSGSMSADGKEIVLSFGSAYNSEHTNFYLIRKKNNGKWSSLKKIKKLNSSANEDAPFLAPDKKTIYFSSDRSSKGQFNIYKSTHVGTDWIDWTKPQPLSDTINSGDWVSYFRTTKNGSWAYFSSTNKSTGKADIFKAKLFEENPFVIVLGKVMNAKNGKALVGKKFSISANGKSIDSIKINYDSATYRAKLPLNNLYQLSASLANFIAQPQSINVKGVKEFTRKKADLYLSPLPYVVIRGKLLVQNTGLPVPTIANPKIWINNVPTDSAKIDAHAATYEMRINHGAVYNIKLTADRFEDLPKKLDLIQVEEHQEMNLDLYVSEIKMAIVRGKILDKKTSKPLVAIKSAKINVEGLTSAVVVIDTLNSTYELKLPLGNQYAVSASAPNYYPLYESVDTRGEHGNIKIYRDLVIVPIEVGQSIRLNNIFFDQAKTTLKKESFIELDRVIEFLNGNPEIKIEIGGHTDNVGTSAGNLKLSLGRAQSVANYIIKSGLPKERIVAKGYGFSKPVVSNATKEGKAKNRRVEFTILDK